MLISIRLEAQKTGKRAKPVFFEASRDEKAEEERPLGKDKLLAVIVVVRKRAGSALKSKRPSG